MNEDLKKIKDKYGEKMMHLCRSLFPTLLETPGLLFDLMSKYFDYEKDLYYDIVNYHLENSFKDYINSLVDYEINHVVTNKTPFELMDEAGYVLYECKSEEDIQRFKKYYAPDEELCTFRGDRLHSNYVFFAVKKNVEDIKRKDFKEPKRQDEYGTSVISIQFSLGLSNTLSIKNRYNHSVDNPDATFSNNLENIIPGLTESFEREYGYKIIQNEGTSFEIPNYRKDNTGKMYKINMEINNKCYCKNNIIIDNSQVIDTYKEKERYLLIDYFIIDLKEKKVFVYDQTLNKDSFLVGVMDIKKIEITKLSNSKLVRLIKNRGEDVLIEIDNDNQIIGYVNNNSHFIGSKFLANNKKLRYLIMNNVEHVGVCFLYSNENLEEISMQHLAFADNFFLRMNNSLRRIYLPALEHVRHGFLNNNRVLEYLYVPKLISADDEFLEKNEELEVFDAPCLHNIGSNSLVNNNKLTTINTPLLRVLPRNFLKHNNSLREVTFESVESLELGVFDDTKVLEVLNLPCLKEYPYNKIFKINVFLRRLLEENVERNNMGLILKK